MAKSKATSGFVYIWYDRKHKRFYIGSHWGTEDDGYVCSSRWMRKSYKRRPEDFKRRIISKIHTNRVDLILEEGKWLSLIKPEEVSIRYYNQRLYTFVTWHSDEEKSKVIGQKISATNIGRKQTFKDPVERGRKISEGKKRAFDKCREKTGFAFTPEHLIKIGQANLGKKHTQEWKDANSLRLKKQWASGQRVMPERTWTLSEESRDKIRQANTGKKQTVETKERLSVRKSFKVGNKIYSNVTRKELCQYINIPTGSYYYEIKRGTIEIYK